MSSKPPGCRWAFASILLVDNNHLKIVRSYCVHHSWGFCTLCSMVPKRSWNLNGVFHSAKRFRAHNTDDTLSGRRMKMKSFAWEVLEWKFVLSCSRGSRCCISMGILMFDCKKHQSPSSYRVKVLVNSVIIIIYYLKSQNRSGQFQTEECNLTVHWFILLAAWLFHQIPARYSILHFLQVHNLYHLLIL